MQRPQCQQPVPGAHGHQGEVGGSAFLAALQGAPTHIYTADGIKQELIQIPQLSSSTSSPDTSPSPGQTLTNSHCQPHFGPPGGQPGLPAHGQGLMGEVQGMHSPVGQGLVKMITGSPNSSPSTAGTPNALSPHNHKQNGPRFHYDTAPHTAAGSLTSGVADLHLSPSGNKVPPLIREFQLSMPDDKEWQSQLFGLLNNQTYNQCEVDLFELMCKVIDQSLFAQVDWARNSIFFKDLKVSVSDNPYILGLAFLLL